MNKHIYTYLGLLQGKSAPGASSRYTTREDMYEYLKEITDEDFGYDIESWEHYFNQYDLETTDGLKLAFKGQLRKTQERKEKLRKAVEDSDNKKADD